MVLASTPTPNTLLNRVVHGRMVAFDFYCLNVSCSSRSYVVFPCLMALTSAKRRYVVHCSALVMWCCWLERWPGVSRICNRNSFWSMGTDLRETICCTQNWAHVEDFAQLCYNPVPSLVSLCPDELLAITGNIHALHRIAHTHTYAQHLSAEIHAR